MKIDQFEIDWKAPIIPYTSLAGIVLGESYETLKQNLVRYCIDEVEQLYQFVNSPILRLEKPHLNVRGKDVYCFVAHDKKIVGMDDRALVIAIKDKKVLLVSVWLFDDLCKAKSDTTIYSYQGGLSNGIKLGSRVNALLPYCNLEFDEAEEWFYTNKEFGGLVVGGEGSSLEGDPEQLIRMLMVAPD